MNLLERRVLKTCIEGIDELEGEDRDFIDALGSKDRIGYRLIQRTRLTLYRIGRQFGIDGKKEFAVSQGKART